MGYYNEKTLKKFSLAYSDALVDVRNGDRKVRISKENTKMGDVSSVSMLPFLTCPACCKGTCGIKCYAAKLANLRPNVLKAYAINTVLANLYPKEYWEGVNEAIAEADYFRFHVSGDILNREYFNNMLAAAYDNTKTELLAFTKRYSVVNEHLDHGTLPHHMHILYSGWTNLKPDNPHNLPETNVIERGATPPAHWKICGGNCFNCAKAGTGCWAAKPGDVIAFNIH